MDLSLTYKKQFAAYLQTCSKPRKKILEVLQWFAQTCPAVFPSQETLAEKCNCSRMTVSRAVKDFVKRGFLHKENRCYRSNLYHFNSHLIWANVKEICLMLKIQAMEIRERSRKITINLSQQIRDLNKKVKKAVTRGVTRGVTLINKVREGVRRSHASPPPLPINNKELETQFKELNVPFHWKLKSWSIKFNFLQVFGFEKVSKAIQEMKKDNIVGDYLSVLSLKCNAI